MAWLVQSVDGVPRIEEGLNPATWMLEVTTPGMEDKLGISFAEQYANSHLAKSVTHSRAQALLTSRPDIASLMTMFCPWVLICSKWFLWFNGFDGMCCTTSLI